ncbi:MAG: hypothetical protein MJ108_08920 [Saccharofermentans sp.]|nr:hypothetical protein [Saccharofermentans sp.]
MNWSIYIPKIDQIYQESFEKTIYEHINKCIEFESLNKLMEECILSNGNCPLDVTMEAKRLIKSLKAPSRLNTDYPSLYVGAYLNPLIEINRKIDNDIIPETDISHEIQKTFNLEPGCDSPRDQFNSVLRNRSALGVGAISISSILVTLPFIIPNIFMKFQGKNFKKALANNTKLIDYNLIQVLIVMSCLSLIALFQGNPILYVGGLLLLASIAVSVFIFQLKLTPNHLKESLKLGKKSDTITEDRLSTIITAFTWSMIVSAILMPLSTLAGLLIMFLGSLSSSVAIPIVSKERFSLRLRDTSKQLRVLVKRGRVITY